MGQRGTHTNFTDEQANAWRTEYDADATLRIVDPAQRHTTSTSTRPPTSQAKPAPCAPSTTIRSARGEMSRYNREPQVQELDRRVAELVA